jgi:hypothetical protein
MQNHPASAFKAQTMHVPVAGIAAATTAQTNVIDTKGFRFAYIVLMLGAVTGTAVTLDFNIESGSASNGSGATDITDALIALTAVESKDNNSYVGVIDLSKLADGHRYLSGDIVTAGTTPAVTFASYVILTQAADSALATAATFSV